MKVLDYDKDGGKFTITFEATHKELFHIVYFIEFAKSSYISDFDKKVMEKIHDELFHILSFFS